MLFPNLDALRAIAALLVVVHHIEQFRSVFGLSNAWRTPFVEAIGPQGVTLFFVLSGFLITSLLLIERDRLGTIAVRAFYLRRVLRIWPLYYVVVAAAFFVLPHVAALAVPPWTAEVADGFGLKLALFVVLCPNVAAAAYAPVPFASQGWSIGTEEQFYLLWPLLLRATRRVTAALVAIIVLYVALREASAFALARMAAPPSSVASAAGWLGMFRIDCMAIGGLGGVAVHERWPVVQRVLFQPIVFGGAIAVTLVALVTGHGVPHLHDEMYAVLFAIIVVNLAAKPERARALEGRAFRELGKISYGLYMLHPLAIVTTMAVLAHLGIGSRIATYAGSVPLTILLAGLSYRLIEQPFLRLKGRFTRVESGAPV